MKILVTGGSGFIGARLIETLQKYHEVINAFNGDGADAFLDLSKPEDFDYSFVNGVDFVFHLASISSPDLCQNHYDMAYKINVSGPKYFLSKCLERGARVVFFSSVNVYGSNNENDFFNEASACNPIDVYAKMKYALEEIFLNEKKFKVFRLSLVFANNDKFTSYLKSCSEKMQAAEVFHPFSRQVVYMGDVLEASKAVIEKFEDFDNQIFNICGPDLMSRKDLADIYKEVVDSDLEIRVIEPPNDFFDARPRIISTKSLYFDELLGRKPLSIKEAMVLEFARKK